MKKENKEDFGRMGEESAASYLCGKGFHILGRNVRCGPLETDIIAADAEYIVFAEVKTRRAIPDKNLLRDRPAAAVTRGKQMRLMAAAEAYLRAHKDSVAGLQPRMDVIEVYLSPTAEEYKVLHLVHLQSAIQKDRSTR